MHIKRFVARDMKHAIRLVRDEQGPDAVILSNQRVSGGIEIIAAVDYDPRLIDQALGKANESDSAGGGAESSAEAAKAPATPALPGPAQAPKSAPAKAKASSGSAPRSRKASKAAPAPTSSATPSAGAAGSSKRRARRPSTAPSRKPAAAASTARAPGKRRANGSSKAIAPRPTARSSGSAPTAKRSRAPAATQAAADTEILLPKTDASQPRATPASPFRHGGREGLEATPRPVDGDDGPTRPVSMTLWREGPEATVELSLVGDDQSPRQDLVDWDPPAREAYEPYREEDDAQDMVTLEAEPPPRSFDETLEAQQQLTYSNPSQDGDGLGAPNFSGITQQRYAEIEDYPQTANSSSAQDEEQIATDELGEDRVELSAAVSEQTPQTPSTKGNGLLSVLANVTRRPERSRARPRADQHPASGESRRDSTLRLYLRSLHRVGMSDPLVRELASAAAGNGAEAVDWPALAGQASARLRTLDQEVIDRGGVVALVGPTGVGKTTSIAKLAARFALKHGRERLALITTDTFRVGAHEQLNTFARILGVPLLQADDAKTFSALMRRLSRHRLVLIDTAGMGQRDLRLAEELSLLSRSRANVQVLLTLCANTERRTMLDTIERFAEVKPAGCVLTKMDEARAPGTALGALIESGIPLAYTSNGQNVPEDLHWARSKRLSLVQQVFHQADMECRDQIDDTDEVRESA